MGNRKIALLFAMALLSLSAGLVVGWVWTPLQKESLTSSATRPSGPRPWFDQLDLSPDQQKQMDKIWGDTRQQMQKLFEHRREMDRQRDQAIAALLNPEQKKAYDQINQTYRASREESDHRRDALMADANARSRALLDDSQKEKWDILSRDMRRRRGMGGPATQHSTTRVSGVGPSAGFAGDMQGNHD